MILARFCAGVAPHSSCAAAASMARCISSRPASGGVASVWPLAGFVTSKVASEWAAFVHSPATKRASIISVLIICTSKEGVRN